METKKYFYYGCLYFFALSITIAGQTAAAPTAASTTGEGPIAGTNQLNQETERDDLSAELSWLRERLHEVMEELNRNYKESDWSKEILQMSHKEGFQLLGEVYRLQGKVYRLQGELDTALAEGERLRSEINKTQLLASRAREDILIQRILASR